MVVVFSAFALSDVLFLKAIGFSMALAVLIDATIVRGVLVPAFMRVMGRLNWWAPAWVQRAVAKPSASRGPSRQPRPSGGGCPRVMPSPRPLAGLTVLDASRVFAGPHATMLMADLGAEVWKLEPPAGDETRGCARASG